MRFLMLNWRCPRNPLSGGAERVTQAYLEALRDHGHQVYWFANQYPGGLAEEEIAGLRIVRGGSKGTSILAARRWYRQQAPFDLVIDQHHGLPWYAPWWCHTHCVAYLHEVLGPIWNVFYRRPTAKIGQWQERWTHWLYRHVQFWTPSTCTQQALHHHGVKRVHVIPNGIDTVALPSLDDKPIGEPLRLIAVSRLAPNKRVGHVILCLDRLRRQGVAAQLTIVGTGGSEGALRNQVAQIGLQGHVHFTGALSEAAKDAELRQAHLLLHASLCEGWGLNVTEANALGTPGVVYPVPGLTESTLHGQTGVVVESETPESLADGVLRCLRDPATYQRYRRAAWERAASFHWSRVLPGACDWLEAQARGDSPGATGRT